MLSGLLKLRAFGVGWTLLVALLMLAIEPAFLNAGASVSSLLVAGMSAVALGWSLLLGAPAHTPGGEPVGNARLPGGDAQLLSEVGAVLVLCSKECGGQFDAMRSELSQVQQLFSEASAKLIDSFHAMSDQARRQQALAASRISPGAGAVGENAGIAAELAEQQQIGKMMEQSVAQAVMSLQFQDMVTQLIGHIAKRVDQLHEIMRDIEGGALLVDRVSASGGTARQAEGLRVHLLALRAHLDQLGDHTRNNPVRQESFGSGEVELF